MRSTLLASCVSVLLVLFAAACATETSASCDSSDDCERGLSCQTNGTCGPYPCSDSSDCLQEGAFQEGCLREDAAGAFDPTVEGLCSDVECRDARGCGPDQVCIEGICYNGSAGPLTCTCREECPSGEACVAGQCGEPIGACNSDCECALPMVCGESGQCEMPVADPCAGVECGEGQTCEAGECVGGPEGCDPPCEPGDSCVDGACVPDNAGAGLCEACIDNEGCGGPADACILLPSGGGICGVSCADDDGCPEGYSCRSTSTGLGNQCVPIGGECGGCLETGCEVGEFCDPFLLECASITDTCSGCTIDEACGEGAACVQYGGERVCLDLCEPGDLCEDTYACATIAALGGTACAPSSGSCSGTGCGVTDADCAAEGLVLDPALCRCVDCVTSDDCPAGQQCTAGGSCVVGGNPCGSTADCPGGYCQGGFCVDCLTAADCEGDDLCLDGACVPCPCTGPNEICDREGNCVEVPDPLNCESNAECDIAADTLGYPPGDYACDAEVGCYLRGACNLSLAGLEDLLGEDAVFGGAVDPFNAACAAGTTCNVQIDLLGGNLFTFTCQGCNPDDDSTCRDGEFCNPGSDIPLLGGEPSCSDSDAGGGGFLPFP